MRLWDLELRQGLKYYAQDALPLVALAPIVAAGSPPGRCAHLVQVLGIRVGLGLGLGLRLIRRHRDLEPAVRLCCCRTVRWRSLLLRCLVARSNHRLSGRDATSGLLPVISPDTDVYVPGAGEVVAHRDVLPKRADSKPHVLHILCNNRRTLAHSYDVY